MFIMISVNTSYRKQTIDTAAIVDFRDFITLTASSNAVKSCTHIQDIHEEMGVFSFVQ